MRIAYLDCFSGISGDMLLGALLDAGVQPSNLENALSKLNLANWELSLERVTKSGISAVNAIVSVCEQAGERHLSDIIDIIQNSGLPDPVKQRSIAVFHRLAEAEAKVHNTTPDRIHFHEVGAVDCIVDVVGSIAGLELLGVEKIFSSPLPASRGFVQCSHGTLPVPAPAVMELLKGVPVVPSDVEGELVTPTGAAIVATVAEGFGPMPAMVPELVGYGAGKKEFGRRPNLLRVVVGQSADEPGQHTVSGETTEVAVLEANIDDMNPEIYEYVTARLFQAGALDVFLTHVMMKKNRPGVLLTAVCDLTMEGTLADIILEETSTLGVRTSRMKRFCLQREFRRVETPYGPVKVKIGLRDGRVLTVSPEYAECRRLAEEHSVPLKDVYRAAISAVKID
jgi:uncharacterized protein (TIGR00299 family) protein